MMKIQLQLDSVRHSGTIISSCIVYWLQITKNCCKEFIRMIIKIEVWIPQITLLQGVRLFTHVDTTKTTVPITEMISQNQAS
jgi:hypothetical protein